MPKRSMAKTSPEKIKVFDDKNPENKDPQSIQSNVLNESSYKYGRERHSNR